MNDSVAVHGALGAYDRTDLRGMINVTGASTLTGALTANGGTTTTDLTTEHLHYQQLI